MKKIIDLIRKNEGYISVELIIVIGLIFMLGGYGLKRYNKASKKMTGVSIDKLKEVNTFVKEGVNYKK